MQRLQVTGVDDTATLLHSVAEQLKIPLAIIARQSELERLTGDLNAVDIRGIHMQATVALTLVESYLLGLQLMRDQTTFDLEPVSIAATIVDVAHELSDFAKQHGTGLEINITGRYGPVMAHRGGLKAALLALGYALLESYPTAGGHLTLAVHRTPHGIVTGLYGDYQELSAKHWRKALAMHGQAAQPFGAVSSGSGAGFFVAETILRAMTAELRVGKYLRKYGLATTLQASQQLQFV